MDQPIIIIANFIKIKIEKQNQMSSTWPIVIIDQHALGSVAVVA